MHIKKKMKSKTSFYIKFKLRVLSKIYSKLDVIGTSLMRRNSTVKVKFKKFATYNFRFENLTTRVIIISTLLFSSVFCNN